MLRKINSCHKERILLRLAGVKKKSNTPVWAKWPAQEILLQPLLQDVSECLAN